MTDATNTPDGGRVITMTELRRRVYEYLRKASNAETIPPEVLAEELAVSRRQFEATRGRVIDDAPTQPVSEGVLLEEAVGLLKRQAALDRRTVTDQPIRWQLTDDIDAFLARYETEARS